MKKQPWTVWIRAAGGGWYGWYQAADEQDCADKIGNYIKSAQGKAALSSGDIHFACLPYRHSPLRCAECGGGDCREGVFRVEVSHQPTKEVAS